MIPEWPGAMESSSSSASSLRWCIWRTLPVAAPARAQRRDAAQDRGREDDAEGDAADHSPPEPGSRAVVGGLLDVQLSVRRRA